MSVQQITESTACPCGSNLAYGGCCALFHKGLKLPATAELLMRSRYCAYVLEDAGYLLDTWVIAKRPKTLDFSLATTMWQKLEIIAKHQGGVNDKMGTVEFKAYYLQDGELSCLHETSRFIRHAGRWYYIDGRIKPGFAVANPGRNTLCACGSGKKSKHCCHP